MGGRRWIDGWVCGVGKGVIARYIQILVLSLAGWTPCRIPILNADEAGTWFIGRR